MSYSQAIDFGHRQTSQTPPKKGSWAASVCQNIVDERTSTITFRNGDKHDHTSIIYIHYRTDPGVVLNGIYTNIGQSCGSST